MSAQHIQVMADIRVMLTKVLREFSSVEISPADLPDWKTLDAAGIDDLDVRDLVFAVEDKFGIMVCDDFTMPSGMTVGCLLKFLAGAVVNGVIV